MGVRRTRSFRSARYFVLNYFHCCYKTESNQSLLDLQGHTCYRTGMIVKCRDRIIVVATLFGALFAFGYILDFNTVSSLSAKTKTPRQIAKGAGKSLFRASVSSSSSFGINRRDWIISGSAFASVLSSQTLTTISSAAAAAESSTIDSDGHCLSQQRMRPTLADEYYNSPFVTNPEAGRSYFPALTPPFNDRATYMYDLGRDAWALEQLLTFANVTATIRCNVVRLKKTGGLWVHSPQWPTGEFCSLLDETIGGPVEHVVLPCNAFEHKAPMKAFLERYPNAQVWIAPGQYGPLGKCKSNDCLINE